MKTASIHLLALLSVGIGGGSLGSHACLATRDFFLAQRFAPHARPPTTTVYIYPSDEEMFERLRGLERCAVPISRQPVT